MSEQNSRMYEQGQVTAYYSEQETAHYSRLELHIIRHLTEVGIISGMQVAGEDQPRYDAADLALLRRVRRLYQDLGINLEGVEIIVRLSTRLDLLQRELARYQALTAKRAPDQSPLNDTST